MGITNPPHGTVLVALLASWAVILLVIWAFSTMQPTPQPVHCDFYDT